MSLAGTVKSETTKQFSTSSWWILGIVLVVYVGSTAAGLAFFFAASAAGNLPGDAPQLPGETLPPLLYSLGTALGYVFPLLIGTLLVTTEIRHQTLTPTFLATPQRDRVLIAKLVVGAGLGALYGVLAIVSSVGPSAVMLALQGVDTQLGDSDTWAMLARMILAFVLWVFIGIAVGALVRNQIAAVVGVLVFTQFVEPIARTLVPFVEGAAEVVRFLPGSASDSLVGASLYNSEALLGGTTGATLDWWAGGLVLLAVAAVLLVAARLFSWRRDVA